MGNLFRNLVWAFLVVYLVGVVVFVSARVAERPAPPPHPPARYLRLLEYGSSPAEILEAQRALPRFPAEEVLGDVLLRLRQARTPLVQARFLGVALALGDRVPLHDGLQVLWQGSVPEKAALLAPLPEGPRIPEVDQIVPALLARAPEELRGPLEDLRESYGERGELEALAHEEGALWAVLVLLFLVSGGVVSLALTRFDRVRSILGDWTRFPEKRPQLLEELEHLQEDPVHLLLRTSRRRLEDDERRAILEILAQRSEPEAIDFLKRSCAQEAGFLHRIAVRGLCARKRPEDIPFLLGQLSHLDPEVAVLVARELGDREAVGTLEQLRARVRSGGLPPVAHQALERAVTRLEALEASREPDRRRSS